VRITIAYRARASQFVWLSAYDAKRAAADHGVGVQRPWSALQGTGAIFPLKRHPQFADQATQSAADPLCDILSTLAARKCRYAAND
jgi:hypothetical protein